LFFLLFPVVSVSDDLCALRKEMEDANVGQGNGKNHAGSCSPTCGKTIPQFVKSALPVLVEPKRDPRYKVSNRSVVCFRRVLAAVRPSRAPPYVESFAFVASSTTAQPSDLDLSLQRPPSTNKVMGLQFNPPHGFAAGADNRSLKCKMLLMTTGKCLHRPVRNMTEPLRQIVGA
jgi:hypothetical protein